MPLKSVMGEHASIVLWDTVLRFKASVAVNARVSPDVQTDAASLSILSFAMAVASFNGVKL